MRIVQNPSVILCNYVLTDRFAGLEEQELWFFALLPSFLNGGDPVRSYSSFGFLHRFRDQQENTENQHE